LPPPLRTASASARSVETIWPVLASSRRAVVGEVHPHRLVVDEEVRPPALSPPPQLVRGTPRLRGTSVAGGLFVRGEDLRLVLALVERFAEHLLASVFDHLDELVLVTQWPGVVVLEAVRAPQGAFGVGLELPGVAVEAVALRLPAQNWIVRTLSWRENLDELSPALEVPLRVQRSRRNAGACGRGLGGGLGGCLRRWCRSQTPRIHRAVDVEELAELGPTHPVGEFLLALRVDTARPEFSDLCSQISLLQRLTNGATRLLFVRIVATIDDVGRFRLAVLSGGEPNECQALVVGDRPQIQRLHRVSSWSG
jgi:hypothetical protein